MPKTAKKAHSILTSLADKSTPVEQRYMLLRMLVADTGAGSVAAVNELLDHLSVGSEESQYNEKLKALDEMLQLMQSGPMRSATFIKLSKVAKFQNPQAY